jgi:hypothetical protein
VANPIRAQDRRTPPAGPLGGRRRLPHADRRHG